MIIIGEQKKNQNFSNSATANRNNERNVKKKHAFRTQNTLHIRRIHMLLRQNKQPYVNDTSALPRITILTIHTMLNDGLLE